MDWTVNNLRGLRSASQQAGGDLDTLADLTGMARADVNRALDAMLGRHDDEELQRAADWLNGKRAQVVRHGRVEDVDLGAGRAGQGRAGIPAGSGGSSRTCSDDGRE